MEDLTTSQVIEAHRASGRFFEVDGIRSFALDYGSGPAVLCLHGVPTSSFLYRKVLRALAGRGLRGVSFDYPGLGLADRPAGFDYSFAGLAAFCAKAVDALGLDRFHLVVHDIGGPVGFALAAGLRERVASLTILNTWIDVDTFTKPLPMQPFEKPLLGEAELALLTHTTWYLGFSTLAVADMSGITKAEAYAYVDLLKREDDGKAFLKIMRSFDHSPAFRQRCYRAVQGVPYPVQALWGAQDPGLTFERYGQEIGRVAGLPEVRRLPARHLLQEDQWEAIAGAVAGLAGGARPA